MMLNELVIKGHVGHRHWSITAPAAGGGPCVNTATLWPKNEVIRCRYLRWRLRG